MSLPESPWRLWWGPADFLELQLRSKFFYLQNLARISAWQPALSNQKKLAPLHTLLIYLWLLNFHSCSCACYICGSRWWWWWSSWFGGGVSDQKKGGGLWQTDNQESLGHEEDLLMRALKYVHSHVLCFSMGLFQGCLVFIMRSWSSSKSRVQKLNFPWALLHCQLWRMFSLVPAQEEELLREKSKLWV